MANELIDMSTQFKGLPMADLIGSPLTAACDAQLKLANATATFIKTVGFLPPVAGSNNSVGDIRTAKFSFVRNTMDGKELVDMDVPLLAIINVPALAVTKVDITFDMEVKSSSVSKDAFDAGAKLSVEGGWAAIGLKVQFEGSISTHKENTRSSDSSAKYHVEVHAEDRGMPEGMARVLDIMHQAITAPAKGKALPAAA